MPFYDYKCKNCGNIKLNVRRSINEKVNDLRCDSCGMHMTLVPNRTAFNLTGGGWYKNGYNGGNKK